MNAADLGVLLKQVIIGQQEILAELAALRAAIERIPRRDKVPRATADLLRAIHAALGDDFIFTSADLCEHAGLLENAGLLAALGPDPTPRRIGKVLARLAGRDLGGLILERTGCSRDGALWTLRV